MGILYFMSKVVLMYAAFIVVCVLMAWYVYGLNTVQGQMVVIFGLVAGVPGAFKLARGITQIGG